MSGSPWAGVPAGEGNEGAGVGIDGGVLLYVGCWDGAWYGCQGAGGDTGVEIACWGRYPGTAFCPAGAPLAG